MSVGREPSLEELRAEARYHRDRFALYRARALTGRITTPERMRELERAAVSAQSRLDRATGRRPSL
jgi:hypothetical protein